MPHLSLRHPEALPLWQATADLHLYRRCKHSSGSVSVGSLGPGAHKVLFEPSETLWRLWGLILNAILPLLLSCWSFSFALGRGIFPHSCSNPGAAAAPAPTVLLVLLCPWTWGTSSQSLQCQAADMGYLSYRKSIIVISKGRGIY